MTGVGVGAAHREGALVIVVVPGQHQVDLVPVEQRQPLLADAEVGSRRPWPRTMRRTADPDDDPVDRVVAAAGRECSLDATPSRAA